jgi:hypothetical protein
LAGKIGLRSSALYSERNRVGRVVAIGRLGEGM